VDAFYGPNISGDALDFRNNNILAGSHRNVDPLELYDFGKRKKICSVDWLPGFKVNIFFLKSLIGKFRLKMLMSTLRSLVKRARIRLSPAVR
jgi:hypothetical protein